MAKGSQKAKPKALALPSRGRNLTKAQKIALAKRVCELYQTNDKSIVQCLKEAGIKSYSTWLLWCNGIDEIDILYKEAQRQNDANYKVKTANRARNALEKALEGFTKMVEEREGEYKENPETGEREFVVTKIRKKAIYIPPKVAAIIYTLNNLDKGMFERSPAGESGKEDRGKYDDWTDEQINQELERLRQSSSD